MTCRYHDAAAVCDRCPDEFYTDGLGFPHPIVCKGRQALRVCGGCERATPVERWNRQAFGHCLECTKTVGDDVIYQGKFSAVSRGTVLDVASVARSQVGSALAERRRPCTVCLFHGKRVDATHVAGTSDGFEWFECGKHEPTDNVAEVTRAKLTPIADWFHGHGLPVPGASE